MSAALVVVCVGVAFCLPDRRLALLTFFESRRLPFEERDDDSVRFLFEVDATVPSPPVDVEVFRCFAELCLAFDLVVV